MYWVNGVAEQKPRVTPVSVHISFLMRVSFGNGQSTVPVSVFHPASPCSVPAVPIRFTICAPVCPPEDPAVFSGFADSMRINANSPLVRGLWSAFQCRQMTNHC